MRMNIVDRDGQGTLTVQSSRTNWRLTYYPDIDPLTEAQWVAAHCHASLHGLIPKPGESYSFAWGVVEKQASLDVRARRFDRKVARQIAIGREVYRRGVRPATRARQEAFLTFVNACKGDYEITDKQATPPEILIHGAHGYFCSYIGKVGGVDLLFIHSNGTSHVRLLH